ncbi:MAG TPA: hypothetical protein PLR71_05265 [Deltaproteobacteria bacterium]|nr:hypothetical protein [Deltaproteobacteria bacterium]
MGILKRLFGETAPRGAQSNLEQKAQVGKSSQSGSLRISPRLVSALGFVYVGMNITEDTKKLLSGQTPDAYRSINPDFSRELLRNKPDIRIIHSFCGTQQEGLHLITKQGLNVAIQTRNIAIAGISNQPSSQVPVTVLIATWFTKPKSGEEPSIIVVNDEIIPE